MPSPHDPRPRGLGGPSDLIVAAASAAPERLAIVAELFGYADATVVPQPAQRRSRPASETVTAGPTEAPLPPAVAVQPTDIPFWRATRRWTRPPVPVTVEDTPAVSWMPPPPAQPPVPINAWSALAPKLRHASAHRVSGRDPDQAALVRRLALAHPIEPMPCRRRRRWGAALQILFDRSQRLVPFRTDAAVVACDLARLFPRRGVQRGAVLEVAGQRLVWTADGEPRPYAVPVPGTVVVVLGDLGCLSQDAASLVDGWVAFGHRLREAGCRPVVVTPASPAYWPRSLPGPWIMVPWDQGAGEPARGRADAVELLLTVLSPFVRIEPGLLRDLRRVLGDRATAATEAEVWQHPAMAARSSRAGALDAAEANRRRPAFEALDAALRARVIAAARRWHGGMRAPEVWHEVVLNLSRSVLDALPGALGTMIRDGDLKAARHHWIHIAPAQVERDYDARDWYRGVHQRGSPAYHGSLDPALKAARQRMTLDAASGTAVTVPSGFDPWLIPGLPGAEQAVRLTVSGDRIAAGAEPVGTGPASPLVTVRTTNGLITVDDVGGGGPADFWLGGRPPGWVFAWDWDDYGPWVSVFLEGPSGEPVMPRLRWVPPGTFLMGSPEDEPGRFPNEGPQHRVTLEHGFWLFEMPCTQALWQAVMGENPSEFQSPDRPVEQVSWEDVQDFIETINARVPGLALTLPSEAQWEYACCAGTETALYTGSIEILGANNAPALDAIAWYGGNSGVDFDLADGWDSSNWPEKQHPHERAGTHRVGRKRPSPWGLYDMLGNVWEWCADPWHDSDDGAPSDGMAWINPGAAAGADRVVRGGSWNDSARGVRRAVRDWFEPGLRDGSLGFRCARVPGSQAGPADAVPADATRVRPAERQAPEGPTGAASLLRLTDPDGPQHVALPRTRRFEIRTDRERVTIDRMEMPAWADGLGRDRFGLWASFTIDARGNDTDQANRPVFVSHGRKENRLVDRLARDLRRYGFKIWHGGEAIQHGETWADPVDEAISDSPFVIVCYTSDLGIGETAAFSHELWRAMHRLLRAPKDRRWFIPVRLDASAEIPPIAIGETETLADMAVVDLATDWDRGMAQLVRVMRPAARALPPYDPVRSLWARGNRDTGLGVTQRLRWIPPGRFTMGSPEDEPGFVEFEGPQHAVTLNEGFWLFETPCTQALWQAVMGENPSHFQTPDRPVEQVSWDQVQAFIAMINARVPGLALTLPSEAQWEYACRAGTATALYTGPIQILGESNAPALDPIAWYGGNSGVDFELTDGWDSRSWKEKQYPHERAGTRPVGRKHPNPWGLYDMLGNVWEWCADSWHETYDGAPTDGTAWIDAGASGAGALRVVRGGSWFGGAGYVRAAVRDWRVPGSRRVSLGFRCARVQS